MIGIDWVVVYDLVSVIGGIVIALSFLRPRGYSDRYDRRSYRRNDLY